jgi:hypothetical protein
LTQSRACADSSARAEARTFGQSEAGTASASGARPQGCSFWRFIGVCGRHVVLLQHSNATKRNSLVQPVSQINSLSFCIDLLKKNVHDNCLHE